MEDIVRLSAKILFTFVFFVPWTLNAQSELHPHRAYYTVSLKGRVDPSSDLIDVRGTMMYELNKVCKGWTVQQLSEIWQYYADGSVDHVRWGYVTWEADDASLFKFNTFRKSNEELIEDVRGFAQLKNKKLEVFFKKPSTISIVLPEGTLFPIQQLITILKAAKNGEHMVSLNVFDGSSDEGAYEINTFIGRKKVLAGNPGIEGAHQFANQPFWPIRASVYGIKKREYEPEYETSQDLLPNGIIKQYVIEQGGVKIQGILERIELLPTSDC